MPKLDPVKNITPAFLKSQIKKKGDGRYGLGQGLYLVAKEGESRRWVFRYTFNGKSHEIGLGTVKVTSLAEAREITIDHRRLIRDGIDPMQARDDARTAADRDANPVVTFETFAKRYYEDNQARWKSNTYRSQWTQSMEDYTFPLIGHVPVNELTRQDILDVLTQQSEAQRTDDNGPLWTVKNETAARLRGRIEQVLDAAKAADLIEGANVATYKGNLQPVLPRITHKEVKHHAAMPYAELPEFMETLRSVDSRGARALEFCILTATRTSETLGARPVEFDLENAIWTIPSSRMKAGKEHRIPLSPQAIACLPEGGRHNRARMFPGHSANELSNMTMSKILRRLTGGCTESTVHGFRSSFRDWCAEQTGFPEQACEIALAHNPKGAVEAAYNRTDYLGMRRALMNHWGEYVDGTVPYIDPHADDGASAYEHMKTPAARGN